MKGYRGFPGTVALGMATVPLPAQGPPRNDVAAPGGGVYPRASGPNRPSPVGRANWRVPTIAEAGNFLNWKVGVPASAFEGLTLSEAAVRIE